MSKHSRREFIIRSAAAGASVAAAQSLLTQEAQAADKTAEMAIAKWSGPKQTADDLETAAVKLTEKAIEGIGGLGRFIKSGDVVWVKPNIAWDKGPEFAANTNPDVVATVVRLCLEAGAKTVGVGDHPCNPKEFTYKNTGIADAARDAGADVKFLDPSRFRRMPIGGARIKDPLLLCPEILDCDVLVNVPVVKHHARSTATICMKNVMGLMDDRSRYHQVIHDLVADLAKFVKPQVNVMDAVRILTNHGPRGGDPADVAVKAIVAASANIVALDAFGAELLGNKPADVAYIVKGQAAGLGTIDYRSVAKEIAVS
ncbi:MAG: DUF362 domain-containing protein [Planctomycetota bacterium]|jgi:uncharacterized protein (DUF362 family)